MRDMLLLAIVAAMFAFGYLVMGRLDRFLNMLCPEEDLSEDAPESEISGLAQVENPCFQCYNSACEKRVGQSLSAGQEETPWNIRTRTSWRSGIAAGPRGS